MRYCQDRYNFQRFYLVVTFIFICGLLILGRLFYCQIVKGGILVSTARKVSVSNHQRGKIFVTDRFGASWPIAFNISKWLLIANPSKIDDPIAVLKQLSPFLGISEDIFQEGYVQEKEEGLKFKSLVDRLSNKNSYYEVLKIIGQQEKEEIEKLKIPGIYFEFLKGRSWPEKKYFGHITGFARFEGKTLVGQYGLEKLLNENPERDIYLTLDRNLQFFSCNLLEEAIAKYQAEGGTIIVLSKDGAVRVMCSLPGFDPNQYSEIKDFHIFENPAVTEPYEPGSIFKVITMASALDANKVKPDSTYFDKGFVAIGPEPEIIKNANEKKYGWQTMTNVLEKSLNTGAVWVARKTGRELFRYYLKEFGFGSLTGIELPGEAKGNLDNLDKPGEIYLATASFGQGITATPLQIANSFLAIANKGKLYRPYIIKEKGPYFVRQVIREKTAKNLTQMLVSVVENGYGRRAGVTGYKIAGKTGTAQVPDIEKGGYSERVIHSFAGFGPAENPQFVGFVKLINPKKGKFSDSTAAPTFSKLAEFVLRYYHIAPE